MLEKTKEISEMSLALDIPHNKILDLLLATIAYEVSPLMVEEMSPILQLPIRKVERYMLAIETYAVTRFTPKEEDEHVSTHYPIVWFDRATHPIEAGNYLVVLRHPAHYGETNRYGKTNKFNGKKAVCCDYWDMEYQWIKETEDNPIIKWAFMPEYIESE